MKIYKIKPSSLSAYNFCGHCLWMSMNRNWSQKTLNLAMNSKLHKRLEKTLQGKPTEVYLPELGRGKVTETGGLVATDQLPLVGPNRFYIAGEFDHVARLENGCALIDDKTTAKKFKNFDSEDQAKKYELQLNAYAYALGPPELPVFDAHDSPIAKEPALR